MTLAILSNRYSDRNGGQSEIAAFCTALEGVAFAAPETLAEIPTTLKAFAKQGVDVLAIDGGDGTIRDVLSALPEAFGTRLPALALIPSGKTNLVARDVGSFGPGVKGVERLLRGLDKGCRRCERAILEVRRGGGLPPVRGLFFGAGIFTFATEMAAIWTFGRGIKQSAGVALTMARVVWRTFRGRHEGAVMAVPAEAPSKPHFVILATTLNALMLGLWPFPDRGEGALKWLAVEAPPRGLLGALWAAWHGRASRREGYRGEHCEQVAIRLTAPFVVDGEVYPPGPEAIILRAGPRLRFLSARSLQRGHR